MLRSVVFPFQYFANAVFPKLSAWNASMFTGFLQDQASLENDALRKVNMFIYGKALWSLIYLCAFQMFKSVMQTMAFLKLI